jgi:hypothetical protein
MRMPSNGLSLLDRLSWASVPATSKRDIIAIVLCEVVLSFGRTRYCMSWAFLACAIGTEQSFASELLSICVRFDRFVLPPLRHHVLPPFTMQLSKWSGFMG